MIVMDNEMVIVVESYCVGENAYFLKDISKEDFLKIQEIIGMDLEDDLTHEHPIKIKLLTAEQNRAAMISGICFGEGCSREQARRIVDGEELLSDEEEEIQSDKEYEELKNKNIEGAK